MLSGVPLQPAVSPVFVGRRTELAALIDALARAEAGEPQALLLGGEAGVGKTRLLEEFLSGVRASGGVTTTGGCLELGAEGLPFAPFTTALRGLRRTLGDPALAAAGEGREAELVRLLPDLSTPATPPAQTSHTPAGGAGTPVPAERQGTPQREESEEGADGGRARLFEATAQLLERLAADRTVVVALEDLQWADRSTRELLAYLFRSVRACRLVLLASYRTDDIHRRHPLRPFLAEQDRLRTVVRVGLPRLTRSEVRAQIAGIQGVEEPESDLVEQVFARSEGIPFFVEELTATCVDCAISDPLRDLLLLRVEALPESAQQMVRLAAGGGSAVEHTLLAAVCGLAEDAMLDALRAAVGANVLRPTEDGAGYQFRHALLREAVREDALPGELARISRRYAEALEAEPSLVRAEERTARLAHYWYRGKDPAKALPAALAASGDARRRHAYAEEHHLLERVIELWDEVPEETRAELPPLVIPRTYPAGPGGTGEVRSGPSVVRPRSGPSVARPRSERPVVRPPHFMEVLAEAVVAARTGGNVERAHALTKRALALLDEAKDPVPSAWFRIKRALLVEDLGKGDGWEDIARAQELVRGLPPSAVHAEVLTSAANWGTQHRPGREALATAVRAVELARVVGATAIEQQARVALGILLVGSGDLEGGLAEMARARDEAAEAGATGVMTHAAINIARELEAAGRSSQAAAEAARAAHLAAERGRPDYHAGALAGQAEALLSTGDWDAAERLIDQARGTARAADTRGWAALLRARLARDRGDLAALEAALEEAVDVMGTAPVPEAVKPVPLRHFALVLAAARGDFEAARGEWEGARKDGFRPGTHPHVWPLLHTAAAQEAETRGLPAAEPGRAGTLEGIRRTLRRLPRLAPVWEAYALLVEAELARAEGESAPAKWAGAVRAFEQLERPHPLARARLRWAEALLDSAEGTSGGGTPDPAELLRQAHEAAARLGAAPLCAEAGQLAARARIALDGQPREARERGTAPGPADPADTFGLTRRERGVLALVAEGHSNRQIAERLHIAPKTASVHVSNILAKLGVSGRGEAAAMAFRLRLVPPPPSTATPARPSTLAPPSPGAIGAQ
ncbi:helix-turn-helix transcriptional regulator [Streptomyces iconiensis]|uniref:AAA family ATPase n=1 Tax=Streptomyces iconiensis TaxID=1384038 RepID=A0ABT6ZUI2_9ACTN|nr:helix-turn-helix transcriptional regulator [Streptomyces iconiensis]MDJ1132474.1 AAA family ATPase [Streptomyces iconiensis]